MTFYEMKVARAREEMKGFNHRIRVMRDGSVRLYDKNGQMIDHYSSIDCVQDLADFWNEMNKKVAQRF